MTRTLADMTPAERAACVGMWCEDKNGNLAVYVRDSRPVENGDRWGESAVVIGGGHDPASDLSRPWLSSLTPRLDLPRAWTPTGAPVPGEWQYHPAYTGVYQDGTTSLNLIGVETYSKQDAEWECADIHRDDPAVRFFPVRRYVTDWEEA